MATKYHNQKTLYNDIRFDSRKEAARYQELTLLERAEGPMILRVSSQSK